MLSRWRGVGGVEVVAGLVGRSALAPAPEFRRDLESENTFFARLVGVTVDRKEVPFTSLLGTVVDLSFSSAAALNAFTTAVGLEHVAPGINFVDRATSRNFLASAA